MTKEDKTIAELMHKRKDKLIEDAFQHLLDTYFISPHRKKV